MLKLDFQFVKGVGNLCLVGFFMFKLIKEVVNFLTVGMTQGIFDIFNRGFFPGFFLNADGWVP